MSTFQEITAEEFDRVFARIGKDWMLIGASDGERDNIMTASWGGVGILWHKPVAFCFIRPQRHTYSITEQSDYLSLSFFDGGAREALTYCGRTSGRDVDKFAGAGFTKVFSDKGIPYPEEASTVLLCRKLYADDLKKDSFIDTSVLSHYPIDDFHRVYICEIEQILQKQ